MKKESFFKRIKTRFYQLAKEKSSVNEIASGAALGAFTGYKVAQIISQFL